MSHTLEVVAILPCAHSVYRHTCEETQGVWMMRITGDPTFYCRHHAIEMIALKLFDGLAVSKVAHLDVDLLGLINLELLGFSIAAYQETPEYDRDEDFSTYVSKVGTIRRAIEALIDQQSAQIELL